jgi:hypothetical protein
MGRALLQIVLLQIVHIGIGSRECTRSEEVSARWDILASTGVATNPAGYGSVWLHCCTIAPNVDRRYLGT